MAPPLALQKNEKMNHYDISFHDPITLSAADHSHTSKYAGEEKREIKSLSEADLEEIEKDRIPRNPVFFYY